MLSVRRSFRLLVQATALVAVAGVVSAAPTPGFTRHISDGEALTAGATIATATGASYAVSSVVGGKPVRWNPCAAIHWTANASRGPVGGLEVLKAAVAGIAAASGTTWVYDGATTAVPTSRWLPTSAAAVKPVLIGWSDALGSDLLRNQPAGLLGMTRTTWFGRVTDAGTVAATRGAVIALDRTDKLALRGNASWSSVALHELGHAMGLAHPAGRGELMNAVLSNTMSGLQSGDRIGLRALGRSAGCIDLGV